MPHIHVVVRQEHEGPVLGELATLQRAIADVVRTHIHTLMQITVPRSEDALNAEGVFA